MINLEIDIAGIKFKNPIIAASGTFGNGKEFSEYYSLEKLGGISSSGVTLNPKTGNKGIRIYETPSGMMNSIGLENPGVKTFIDEELDDMLDYKTNIIVNLGGNTLEEYIEGATLLDKTNIDMIELNISCPNVKEGGIAFGMKSDTAYDVVSKVRKATKKPLIVKLSPNASDISEIALACEKAGADAISLVNTFNALAIDIYNRKPIFDNITAGLSGPGIKPIALRIVYEVSKTIKIPIIGIGGITSGQDVIEFIMAGATAVQVGSANFIKPDICLDILSELKEFMLEENINNLQEIRAII